MNLLDIEIISKICECILQSRIAVKKTQYKKFDSVIKQLKNHPGEPYGGNINAFLSQLLQTELYHVRKKLMQQNIHNQAHYYVRIQLYLMEKKTGRIHWAEDWIIELQMEDEYDKDNHQIVFNFFEELIYFMNKKPLFACYQKNKELRTRYMLDYRLNFEPNNKQCTLLDLPICYLLKRETRTMQLKVKCLYLPDFEHLKNKKQFHSNEKLAKEVTEEEESDRKVSLYSFYDNELDFVFISSDNDSFNKKEDMEQYKIDPHEESEEFELLYVTEEEQYMHDHREIYDRCADLQDKYLG